MKKLLLLFAAAVCAVASWAQTEATVSATVKGDKLEVALTNETEEFVAFQMDITLPEGVTVADDGAVALVAERLTQPGTAASFDNTQNVNFVIAYNKIDATHVRVIAYNLANRAIAGNEGALFNVTFVGTPAGNFVLDNVLFVTTTDLEEIKLQLAESVPGASYVLGDINNSGEVEINDLVALVDILSYGQTAPECKDYNLDAANVNGEGGIDINDLVALIELL